MFNNIAKLPLVEIGWLVAGKLDTVDWQAVQRARESVTKLLSDTFVQFRWQMPVVQWAELAIGPRTEPAELLEYGVAERNAKHWDLTLIVTAAELTGHYRAEPVAVVSRSLDSILISTSLLDPRTSDPEAPTELRTSVVAARLQRLVLYAFGRVCGLEREDKDRGNLLFFPADLSELDEGGRYCKAQTEQLNSVLEDIADRRLEETTRHQQARVWQFYLLSVWVNRRDIAKSVREAKPWQFPFRLSRLTTAALSAMLILLVTAEVWELAISQGGALVALLSIVSVCIATLYIVLHQRLYVRRGKSRLTEQTVTTNVSMGLVVLLGMLTTYLLIFSFSVLAGSLFFHSQLVVNWTAHAGQPPLLDEYLLLSAFVAAFAICIGALGASFESNHYFRHITFVDEEI